MFNEKIESHSAWRQTVNNRLATLEKWLKNHDLLSADMQAQLSRMQMHNRSEKLMVAFVAEFSRGKSELINAIFFAGYGKRIMPASAGRTTMCPTELGYNEDDDPCLLLLPIHTRLGAQPLMEWRLVPDQWIRVDLDVNDPDQLIAAMNKVSETIEVSVVEAHALGFWDDEDEGMRAQSASGLVEVPKWRHALINMDHPLLRQGLIILDTPGLNAIGAEPELTMSLIPQAQAVVFILAADTGVTASDLSMWREFLSGTDADDASRFVVLNKIDTLWDDLSTPQQVAAQIEKQRVGSAKILGLSQDRVTVVSAQKGLLAKVNGDAELLQASRLPELERILSEGIVRRRQQIMQNKFQGELGGMMKYVRRTLGMRRAELTEQLADLDGLHGKNENVIRHQRARIVHEQEGFDTSVGRMHAMRMVHRKILQKIYVELGSNQLLKDTGALNAALRESGFMKLGVKKAYRDAFGHLEKHLDNAQEKADEIYTMFVSMFKQVNEEFGFTLQAELPPRLDAYKKELADVETSHEQYLGVNNILRLSQSEFVDRLIRALVSRLRAVFENALNEIDQWSRSMASQIDGQLRERRRSFKRRLGAIERAETASSELDARIHEVRQAAVVVEREQREFEQLLQSMPLSDVPMQAAVPA